MKKCPCKVPTCLHSSHGPERLRKARAIIREVLRQREVRAANQRAMARSRGRR